MEGPIKNNKESNEKEKKIITEEDFEYAAKQWKYKTIAWIFVFVVFAVILTSSITYYITIGKKYNDLYSATSDIDSEENVEAGETISDISKVLNSFAEVIDENYVGSINKEELIDSTIKGFVDGVGDEYSEYMTAEEWNEYQETALGNYCGVGIYMTTDEER